MSRRHRPAGVVLVLVLVLLPVLAACGDSDDGSAFGVEEAVDDGEVTYDFHIPAGTGERLAAGEPVEILPRELDVTVGEVIRIVNDDETGHLVGPWFVGAGETLRQRFASPGEFLGVCTVHPSGEIVVTVSEA